MSMYAIAIIVLILWNINLAFMLRRHEAAIVELLILHPQLLQEEEDGSGRSDQDL